MSDYTKYEYQDIVDSISQLFEGVDGWGDGYQSSMGQTLIQLLADTTDSLHYIQERRVRESYLETAKLRSSILALAGSMSYRPRRRISSGGILSIRVEDDEGNPVSPSGNIFIPRMTRVFFDSDNSFVTMEDILLTPESPEVEFRVMEGSPHSLTIDPSEDNTLRNYNYILLPSYDDMENDTVIVRSQGGEWRDVRASYDDLPPVGALTFLDPSDRYYDIIPAVGGMRIIFGNNTFGKKPATPIEVEWVRSSGAGVNIAKTGVEFRMEDNVLVDDINVTPRNEYEYRITNITPIHGGLDEESIEDIRIRAMEYNKTGDRATTREDYNHMIIRSGIGGIVDFNTYGEQELGINMFRMNHIFGAYLTSDGADLTKEQEESLRAYIEKYAVANPHLSVLPAKNLRYQYNLKIAKHPNNRVSDFEVYDHVRSEIAKLFEIQTGSIGKPYYHSEMWEIINGMLITKDGVTYKVANYIDLEVNPVFEIESPVIQTRSVVKFSDGQEGDVYSLVIDGEVFSYTLGLDETFGDVMNYFTGVLGEKMLVTANHDELILTAFPESWFTISSTGSTDGLVTIDHVVQIPPRFLNNGFNEDQFVRGSLEVMNADLEIVLTDNGIGELLDSSNQVVGSINYKDATLSLPILSEGQYFIRYQEDEFKNIKPNERTYVSVLQPKETLEHATETLSTIEFI